MVHQNTDTDQRPRLAHRRRSVADAWLLGLPMPLDAALHD